MTTVATDGDKTTHERIRCFLVRHQYVVVWTNMFGIAYLIFEALMK